MIASPSLASSASVARYAIWLPIEDRRVICACRHRWALPGVLRSGAVEVRCSGDRGRGCGRKLLVLVVPEHDQRLIAEVTDADMAFIRSARMRPETELAYLLSTPMRSDAS